MKKILAIVLAVVMLLPVFAVNSFAADDVTKIILNFDGDQSVNKEISDSGTYSFEWTGNKGTGAWLVLKCGENNDEWDTKFPEGTTVELTEFVINDTDYSGKLIGSFEKTITISASNKKVVFPFWNDYAGGSRVNDRPDTITSIKATIKVTLPKDQNADVPTVEKEVAVDLASVNKDAAEGFSSTDDGVSFTGGRITFKLPNAVSNGDIIKVRVTGKANGVFRSFLSDAAIKGSGWNQSPVVFFPTTMMDDDGNFDVVVEYTAQADLQYILFAKANAWDIPAGETEVADDITINSVAVVVPAPATSEKVLFSISERVISDPWSDGFLIGSGDIAKFVAACQAEGAEFRLVYSVTKETWCNFNLNGNSNTYVDGEVSGDPKKTGLGAPVSGIDMTPGENKELKMSGADLLKFFTDQEGKTCNGLWSPDGSVNVGDIYHGFDDVNNIASLQIQPGEGNIFTVVSIQVVVPGSAEEAPAKKIPGYKGCIYVNDQYHAYLIGGHFLVMSHEDNGLGQCKGCYTEMSVEAEDAVPQDKIIYEMTAAGGQDVEGDLAEGLALADNQEGIGNCRIATNWKGSVWEKVTKAIADNADAYVKIVYTGNVDKLVFQTENGGYEQEFDVTESNNEDGKSVAFISCADIIAGSPVALSGNFGGWANLMLHFDGEATLYGFTVMVPAPVALPADEVIEVVEPTESNNPDEEDETPDNTEVNEVVEKPEDKNPPTGIALAVLPMIVAAAACVASKRK